MVEVFHSSTHKACLLDILQVEVRDRLCQSFKLAKHNPRGMMIIFGEETLLKKCGFYMVIF